MKTCTLKTSQIYRKKKKLKVSLFAPYLTSASLMETTVNDCLSITQENKYAFNIVYIFIFIFTNGIML